MNFDDLFDESTTEAEDENPCLADSAAALSLVMRIYSSPRREGDRQRERQLEAVRSLMEVKLPDTMGRVALENAAMRNDYVKLPALATAVAEQVRLPLLRGKTIIGVGGKFSAGKSRFLNVLTGSDRLPEGQQPTTAVGTYLVNAAEFSINAYTATGQLEQLNINELKAISHDFLRKFGLGFSRALHKIVITSPELPPGIALLDTPGYNNVDASFRDDALTQTVDAHTARSHLMSCDFLIWLVDAADGCLCQSDLDFMASLNLRHECLVVFNKADLKPDDALRDILQQAPQQLQNAGIPFFGVTAFSSVERQERFGNTLMESFMHNAATFTSLQTDILTAMATMRQSWDQGLHAQQNEMEESLTMLEYGILNSGDPCNIASLLDVYSLLKQKSISIHWQSTQCSQDMLYLQNCLEKFFQ